VTLVFRLLWVILAFLLACAAAAVVVTLGLLVPELSEAADPASHALIVWMTALWAVVIAVYAMLPAMLLIVIAEGFGLRSFLIYAVAGGALAGLGFGLGDASGIPIRLPPGHDTEVVLAAGIAGGLFYWLLAGRRAGDWRKPRRPQGPTFEPDRL
jgi:hypothetical protein